MVLDPKATSLHNDYGSFDRSSAVVEGHERDVEAAVDGSNINSGMAQSSDVYQRQPLLPNLPSKNRDKWSGVSSNIEYYEDETDRRTNGLGHSRLSTSPNGDGSVSVKLDIPVPQRDKPRFPKEKWKTFVG